MILIYNARSMTCNGIMTLCKHRLLHPADHILPSTNVNQSLLSRCSVPNDLLLLHKSVKIFDPPAPVLTSGLTLFPTPIPLILTHLTWPPMLLKHFQPLALNYIHGVFAPILTLFTIYTTVCLILLLDMESYHHYTNSPLVGLF